MSKGQPKAVFAGGCSGRRCVFKTLVGQACSVRSSARPLRHRQNGGRAAGPSRLFDPAVLGRSEDLFLVATSTEVRRAVRTVSLSDLSCVRGAKRVGASRSAPAARCSRARSGRVVSAESSMPPKRTIRTTSPGSRRPTQGSTFQIEHEDPFQLYVARSVERRAVYSLAVRSDLGSCIVAATPVAARIFASGTSSSDGSSAPPATPNCARFGSNPGRCLALPSTHAVASCVGDALSAPLRVSMPAVPHRLSR